MMEYRRHAGSMAFRARSCNARTSGDLLVICVKPEHGYSYIFDRVLMYA